MRMTQSTATGQDGHTDTWRSSSGQIDVDVVVGSMVDGLHFLVDERRSAEVKVSDEEHANEDDHSHNESEYIGEHSFSR